MTRKTSLLLIAWLPILLGVRSATAQNLEAQPLDCYPKDDNAAVHVTAPDEAPGTSTRLYFRWDEDEDFYYVFMVREPGGRYWATPPRAKDGTEVVEYYAAQQNTLGEVVARSELLRAPVSKDCEAELDERERSYADNLTVGETVLDQEGQEIEGFKCDGVITRINADNLWRQDAVCSSCLVIEEKDQPEIVVEPLECHPPNGQGVVHAQVFGEIPVDPPVLYVRWGATGEYRALPMQPAGEDSFWTPLPQAGGKEEVSYFAVLIDPVLGVTARSQTHVTPVTGSCALPPLTPDEQRVADNLPEPGAPGGGLQPYANAVVPTVRVAPLDCYPKDRNGLVHAVLSDELPYVDTRLYFRWDEDEDFYYVFMVPEGEGRYWTTPPRPKDENEGIEYYVALVDPLGEVLARSDILEAPVTSDCKVELTGRQFSYAANLTVGETTHEQEGEEVDGFQCFGVITRLNPDRIWRFDNRCRACIVVWPRCLGPAALAAVAGGIIIDASDKPEASPVRPRPRPVPPPPAGGN